MLNPSIGAGELCQTIQIQTRTTAQDSLGGQVEAWNTVLTTRAAIYTAETVPGMRSKLPTEASQAGEFSSQVTHVMKIRWPGYTVPVQGGQRVIFRSRLFTLQSAENVQERNRVLLLYCLEINGVQ